VGYSSLHDVQMWRPPSAQGAMPEATPKVVPRHSDDLSIRRQAETEGSSNPTLAPKVTTPPQATCKNPLRYSRAPNGKSIVSGSGVRCCGTNRMNRCGAGAIELSMTTWTRWCSVDVVYLDARMTPNDQTGGNAIYEHGKELREPQMARVCQNRKGSKGPIPHPINERGLCLEWPKGTPA